MPASGSKWDSVSEFLFQGKSDLTLDNKGRLTVPARHRDVLLATTAGQLTLTTHPRGCLLVFPRPVWESFRERLLALPMEADGWRRIFIGNAVDVEIDSGSRIHISPELRAEAGLTQEVSLLGNGRNLEIWDQLRLKSHAEQTQAGAMPDAIKSFVF